VGRWASELKLARQERFSKYNVSGKGCRMNLGGRTGRETGEDEQSERRTGEDRKVRGSRKKGGGCARRDKMK